MSLFERSAPIIVTCHKRLAPFLAKEVMNMGFTPARTFVTGIELSGTLADCMRLNMKLRTASQVLFSLRKFRAAHPDEVYQFLKTLPWEQWLPAEGYFSVTSQVDQWSVNNPLFVNVRVKDAIVDRFRDQIGQRPNSGPDLSGAVVHLYWKDDQAEVFMDTSGPTLAKHGYRKIPGQAPMLEALAAAAVMATGWSGTGAFVNPMCGSGTLAIEAALMATHRHPGLYRSRYAFQHWIGYDPRLFEALQGALAREVQPTEAVMVATDIRPDAIDCARVNARAAGVEELIQFRVCDFADTPLPPPPGILFFNPAYGERLGETLPPSHPTKLTDHTYGERLGEIAPLTKLYERMGDFMKQKAQGYQGFIFTGNLELAKKVGLKASRRIEFYNAQIDCRLLAYELYTGSRRAPRPA